MKNINVIETYKLFIIYNHVYSSNINVIIKLKLIYNITINLESFPLFNSFEIDLFLWENRIKYVALFNHSFWYNITFIKICVLIMLTFILSGFKIKN